MITTKDLLMSSLMSGVSVRHFYDQVNHLTNSVVIETKQKVGKTEKVNSTSCLGERCPI